MEKNLFNCLNYCAFAPALWKFIRTTNIQARAFREARRRTRFMNNFCTNEASSDRIM